jgi:membrane-bound serine protease (ClpP class)
VAESIPDLLGKIDGRTVKTSRGDVALRTKGAAIDPIEIGLRDRILNVITDPNVAYILMTLGVLGLFFELANPGVILPGVIGGISLILAFFAFQSLPINYAGLLLILFGVILLVAEIKVVSHGILSIGGAVSMVLGSLMLYDAPAGMNLRVSWAVIIPMVGLTVGLFAIALAAGVRALARRPVTGAEGLIGLTGLVREPLTPEGLVLVQGELWRAVADGAVPQAGEPVRVVAIDGLKLKVVKADAQGGGR